MLRQAVCVSTGKGKAAGAPGVVVHELLGSAGPALCSLREAAGAVHAGMEVLSSSAAAASGGGGAAQGGGLLLTVNPVRAEEVDVFSWAKQSRAVPRMQLPEKMGALAVIGGAGEWVVCGGAGGDGMLYIWELRSGRLVNAWQAHTGGVAVVRATKGDAAAGFVSAGAGDGMVHCWNLVDVLGAEFGDVGTPASATATATTTTASERVVTPWRTWHAHTLGVTDLHVACESSAGCWSGLVTSCARDQRMLVHEPLSHRTVFSIDLPRPALACTATTMGDIVFAGAQDGVVYAVQWVLGPDALAVFEGGHTEAVTSVSCSADDSTLVSGSLDGDVRVWDIATAQCLCVLVSNVGPISNVHVFPFPPEFAQIGGAGALGGVGGNASGSGGALTGAAHGVVGRLRKSRAVGDAEASRMDVVRLVAQQAPQQPAEGAGSGWLAAEDADFDGAAYMAGAAVHEAHGRIEVPAAEQGREEAEEEEEVDQPEGEG